MKQYKIYMPKDVEYIINTLTNNSFEAFVVGGCVRDSLLERNLNDWDITTNASPESVKSIFEDLGCKVIPTGIKHGTVTILIHKEQYEITTYRLEGEYEDFRRPKEVIFTKSLKEDLKRRDFTINAMAYNEKDGLVDYFSGKKDLEHKIIRTVGDAKERFNEDALRLMRAVRFSAQLGFTIEEKTKTAIEELSGNLQKISVERIREEFNKIILSNNLLKIEELYNLKILKVIMPEFDSSLFTAQNNPHHIYDVFHHTINTMEHIEAQLHLRLTMLFHDIGKPKVKTTDENGIDHFYKHQLISANMAYEILKRFKYDNKTIEKVVILVKEHDNRISSKKSIRRLLNKIGEENFKDLIKVWEADMRGQNPKFLDEKILWLDTVRKDFNEILESKECFSIRDLDISGEEIIELGVKQGKEVGEFLNHLLDKVLEEPCLNEKHKLKDIVKEIVKQSSLSSR